MEQWNCTDPQTIQEGHGLFLKQVFGSTDVRGIWTMIIHGLGMNGSSIILKKAVASNMRYRLSAQEQVLSRI